MAKSKLLTAAVMCSALVLVACGGNTNNSEQGSVTSTEPTEVDTLTINPDDTVELEVIDVEPEPIVEVTEVMMDITFTRAICIGDLHTIIVFTR